MKFSIGIFIFLFFNSSSVAFTTISDLLKDFIIKVLSEYSIVSNLPLGYNVCKNKKNYF